MSKKFPDRLRAARELKDWTQAELAARAKLMGSAISHFETGRRAPSFANLKRLADALSVTVDYLLGRVDEPAASGARADKFFRDFAQMSASDQDSVAAFADVLAKKNKDRQNEDE